MSTADEADELTVEGFITDRDIVVQAVALDLAPRDVAQFEEMRAAA